MFAITICDLWNLTSENFAVPGGEGVKVYVTVTL